VSTEQTPRERAAEVWNNRRRPTPRRPITAHTIAAAVMQETRYESGRWTSQPVGRSNNYKRTPEQYPDTEPRTTKRTTADRMHITAMALLIGAALAILATVALFAVVEIARTEPIPPTNYGTAPSTQCDATPTPSHILCYNNR
jgi:hypothetical protein